MAPVVDIQRLVLEVTADCNNACGYCYNHWRGMGGGISPNRPLSRAQIYSLIEKLKLEAPISTVALSGGEPLLRPELPDIACDLVELGIAPVVITNGVRLTPAVLKKLPADTLLELTLLSPHPEVHDRLVGRPVLEKILLHAARVRKFGHRWVLACVVTHENAADVELTIELAIALGAEGVLLNRLNPNRRILSKARQLLPSADDLRQALAAADRMAERYGLPIAVSVPIPPCVIDISPYTHLHFGWCPRGGPDSYYTVDWAGRLRPCNHSSCILGDARTERLEDMVRSLQAEALWSYEPSQCAACDHPLRQKCRGGCPAAIDESRPLRREREAALPDPCLLADPAD